MSEKILHIADIMRAEVRTVGRNDKLSAADTIMKEYQIRHLPVLDRDRELCGILTHRDIFRGMLMKSLGYGTHLEQKMLDNHLVKEAMNSDVVTTSKNTRLGDAAKLIISSKIGCLPVTEGKKVIGIVTKEDFLAVFIDD